MIENIQKHRILLYTIFFTIAIVLGGCGVTETPYIQPKDKKSDEIVESSGTETTSNSNAPSVDGDLEVHYIDVGQGDSTLLLGPDFTILIDAGRHDRNDVVPYLKKQGVSTIDLVIGTHPHADHIGQLDKVMESFNVKEVWMSGDEHTSATFERVLDAILATDAEYHEPRAGESHTFGSAILEVLHPDGVTGNLNDGSISLRVIYGQIKFAFTGDLEHNESAIINRGHDVQAHIFQLGHHGSSTSNTQEFLNAVNPEIAIYSAGKNNSYGHPHDEVVNRINHMEIPLYGTDIHGSIIIKTDGKSYEVYAEKVGNISAEQLDKDTHTDEEIENDLEKSDSQAKNGEISPSDCVDLNTASIEKLKQIIHIGDARVGEIIDLRPITTVDSLSQINGIGAGRLSDIKEQGLACVK